MKELIDIEALERIFHEPNRLAIMSELCGVKAGLSFTDLKSTCGLTDGNLNRHLKVLQEAGVINITKKFVGAKPLTTVTLSRLGLKRFSEYLETLSSVLKRAQKAMSADARSATRLPVPGVRPVRA